MHSFRDSAFVWVAALLGRFLALLGAFQSVNWFTAFGSLIVIGSIFTVVYAAFDHRRVESAALQIAGRNIESLKIADLYRRRNQTLRVQVVHYTAVINGEDLTITWKCVGYCRAGRETSIEFSIDSDNNVPFDQLRCFAYDLQHDPKRRCRIRPVLIGPDGVSKKVAVPFLAPIDAGQLFNVALTCELPGCMKSRVDYYTASLSLEHDDTLRYMMRLVFVGNHPEWLRVYEVGSPSAVKLVKEMRPGRVNNDAVEYLDTERHLPAKSVRLYVFERSAAVDAEERMLAGITIGSN